MTTVERGEKNIVMNSSENKCSVIQDDDPERAIEVEEGGGCDGVETEDLEEQLRNLAVIAYDMFVDMHTASDNRPKL